MAVEKEALDLKAALKREREEHQHLLADSYAAVMDLTKQLQIGERNWSRERLELLERFNQEQRLLEAQSKVSWARVRVQGSSAEMLLHLFPFLLPLVSLLLIPSAFSS